VLKAEGLHTYYGPSHILRGIDFFVGSGEMIGLLGRNGMGKTTLLRTLIGLTKPRRGSVHVRGVDMTHAAPHLIARAGIAYVPEGRGIFANLSVRENLVIAARRSADGGRAWDLDRVLAIFPRLAERLGHGGGQLSGGEQQMLTIGRALMTNPELIILDEATEGLAPRVRRDIWGVIRDVRAAGIAVVVVDKDHATVNALADRSVILVKGRTVFAGKAAELENRPDILHRHLGVAIRGPEY
jgi:branched-chain amino acid transport system ATP-binding protein